MLFLRPSVCAKYPVVHSSASASHSDVLPFASAKHPAALQAVVLSALKSLSAGSKIPSAIEDLK